MCLWHSFIHRYDICLQEILAAKRNPLRSFSNWKRGLGAQEKSDRGPWEGIVE